MSHFLGQPARNLLEAPLLVPHAVERLGRAIWLYVRLLAATSVRGLVCRRRNQLAGDLGVDEAQIDQWLTRLADAKLIEVQTPGEFLVIKLGMWFDSASKEGGSGDSAYSFAKQLLQSQQQRLNNGYRQEAKSDVAPNENELLKEILETLGESDGAAFEKAVELYSPKVIREALQRVRRAQGIRKSRTALFRYLLGKISHDHHAAF